jgi:hypothetical protein
MFAKWLKYYGAHVSYGGWLQRKAFAFLFRLYSFFLGTGIGSFVFIYNLYNGLKYVYISRVDGLDP